MLVGYVGRQGKRVTQAQAIGIIRGLSGQLLGLLKEWMIRVINGLGGLEPLLDLLGLSIRKKIRVHVAILPDASKSLGMTATPSSADGPLDAMQNIFWNEANVTLTKGRDRVRVLKDVAPDAALRVHCDAGTIANDLGEAAEYFRSHARRSWRGALGYGDPVTIFIVNEVVGKDTDGCSLGMGTNYVTLEAGTLNRGNRMMAHGVGHACGLKHVSDGDNLMAPRKHGRKLKRRQKALFRNSRHVTHI